jgi:hypothetical protein
MKLLIAEHLALLSGPAGALAPVLCGQAAFELEAETAANGWRKRAGQPHTCAGKAARGY